jgi:hypothetical protein
MIGRISQEAGLRAEVLMMGVQRQIMCDITGQVLDVRTAVYIETTGKSFCISGDAWADKEAQLRTGIEYRGWKIGDVIEGKKLTEEGVKW